MRVNRSYSEEFKSDALTLLRRGDRGIKEVALALGMSHWTLRDWYNQDPMSKRANKAASVVSAPPPEETPDQLIARLKRENAQQKREIEQLRMDREILKKAAAFFAKESE